MNFQGSLLRNIRVSGGLFTENIILRLRDNPSEFEIGKIESFIKNDTKKAKLAFKKKRRDIYEWCIQKWDEISFNIDKFSLNELINKWLIPFFSQFGHEIEKFILIEDNIDEDSSIKGFKITHQSKNHSNPFFQFININEDFDSKITSNPQNKSHHDICQQFINLNPEIKWLIISNGRLLRILTKYYHSYSKGYLEFDLENILANRDWVEFTTLFSLLHKSRFISDPKTQKNLIEVFQEKSTKEGIKIGDKIRDNVRNAIELLGNGFIQQNLEFLNKLNNGQIELQDFYAELLRIIYRIIFILYAEQRGMLPGAGTLYFEQFSLSSFRILAEKPIKPDNNVDLWNKLLTTFKLIKDGNEILEVPCYNGELFNELNLRIVFDNKLSISNDVLLRVIRLLTTSKEGNLLQRINFLEISEEEIGAIYESLLDFKPYLNSKYQFQLIPTTIERKSTGTYYTPRSLIDILIRTTLQPLVEDRLEKIQNDKKAMENAILNIKVCDPACGGGTFLLAALDFLGKKLAEIRTGIDSPSTEDLRQARRDVLQHCIYGVDKNPLAVELAKISLWLRACVKDKPLNFLNNHIKCGNSLIGIGKKLAVNGIKPKAFKAIEGNPSTGIDPEKKSPQNEAREIIRNEIKMQQIATVKGRMVMYIPHFLPSKKAINSYSEKFQKIVDLPEDTPDLINEKAKKYEQLRNDLNYQKDIKKANTWTATFFWPFEIDRLRIIPRNSLIVSIDKNNFTSQERELLEKISEISEKYQFFHWYLEFPEVFSHERNGFDCILTNPPWDTLQLKEIEFFTGLHENIVKASNQSERRKLIKELKKTNPELFESYRKAWISMKKVSHYLRNSGFFKLTAKGTINLYALFVERCWHLISNNGYVGMITPTGVVMNYNMQDLFKTLIRNKALLCVFDFENRRKLFDIDSRYRFCLLSLGGREISQEIVPMTFYTLDPKEIQEPLSIIFENKKNLKEKVKKLPDNHILIPLEQKDFELLYNQAPVLLRRDVNTSKEIFNPWEIKFLRMFDMSNDSNLFLTQKKLQELNAIPINDKYIGSIWIDPDNNKYLPLYEGKMIWLYNHRYNSVKLVSKGKYKERPIQNDISQLKDPHFCSIPVYWVEEKYVLQKIGNYNKNWFIAFRDVTGATNERTFISTIIPKTAVGGTLPLILSLKKSKNLCCLLANFNSIIFDYIVRQKISGNHIALYILEQLPVLSLEKYNTELIKIITSHLLELIYTSYNLKEFANDLGYNGKPFDWDFDRRMKLQTELDAIYAHLYKIEKKDLVYILNTFSVLKENEIKRFKEFRTKRLILEAYDRFSEMEELFE
ncbi:MAG: Eco57I restriction-modification methylase domain-containing protein [Candidatus Helarchaeota archaeon]